MIPSKYQKLTYGILVLCGAGYFLGFSQLNVPFPFLKAYAAMIPIQVAALIYVVLLIRSRNLDSLK